MIYAWLERTSEQAVLVTFWTLFLLCALAALVPRPYWYFAGGLTQVALLAFWVGYSLVVYSRFTAHRLKLAMVALMAVAPLLGVAIAGVTEDFPSAGKWSLLGFVLFLIPFGAAAYALRTGERKSLGQPRTNPLVAGVTFFALPFFGGFIHSRVRAAIRALKT